MDDSTRTKRAPRTIRVRTLIITASVFVVLLAGTGLWLAPFLRDQVRAVIIGNLEVAALKHGSELPYTINRVELLEIVAATSQATTITIRTMDLEQSFPVGKRIVLTGAESEAFTDAWRSMAFGWGYASLCHEPGFVLRFMEDDQTFLETSLCFKCRDFYVPTPFGATLVGFDLKAPRGQALLDRFKLLFPDSDKWTEPNQAGKVTTP